MKTRQWGNPENCRGVKGWILSIDYRHPWAVSEALTVCNDIIDRWNRTLLVLPWPALPAGRPVAVP